MAVGKYLELSKKYLEEGEELLARGDVAQACEKFWGAVAEVIKAVAESRGWEHAKHRHLMEVVSRLFGETEDRELLRLVASAERLHPNFYEDFMSREEAEVHIEDSRKLVGKLEMYLRA